ncbi:peptide chain release factor N(5)-glutamine methyltransferase [Jannaschia sp. Os4]|uniref:peptide chain release factor N(5)-glutamine methyltransferase n=1 Tax=Jannaschia sp. Os4 TaxID=2807617 RepID=UPI0031B5B7B4
MPDPAGDLRRLMAHHAPGAFPDDDLPDPAGWARLVEARAARVPVSHLVGRRAFWRHDFAVTGDVLDPRPETEMLVAAALEAPFARVVDLGTGSGAILGSLLAGRPDATGVGTDLSDAALAVAARNLAALGVDGRATLLRADWWEGVEGRFDLIVSNPPYIAAAEMAGLAPELAHEPRMALTPGGDGLDAYRAIAAGAAARLAPGGRILLEIGPTQAGAVSRLLREAGLGEIGVKPDLDGRDRVVFGRNTAV